MDGHCYCAESPTSQNEDGSCESEGNDDGCNGYINDEEED
jgi:hypothetical protein